MSTPPPSSTRPILPNLATELVEIVSHCLERIDLLSLRLVCKALYQKSLCTFGTLLTTIRTDLSEPSLLRLRALGSHDLRLYVEKLLIEPCDDGKLGQGIQWHRHSSGYIDVLSPGPRMLGYLLAHKLPNCRILHIRNLGGTEDESDTLTHSDAIVLIFFLIPFLPTTSPVKSFIVDARAYGNSFLDAKKLLMAQFRRPSFLHAWAHVQEIVLEHVH